jgi:hypothetical protein
MPNFTILCPALLFLPAIILTLVGVMVAITHLAFARTERRRHGKPRHNNQTAIIVTSDRFTRASRAGRPIGAIGLGS